MSKDFLLSRFADGTGVKNYYIGLANVGAGAIPHAFEYSRKLFALMHIHLAAVGLNKVLHNLLAILLILLYINILYISTILDNLSIENPILHIIAKMKKKKKHIFLKLVLFAFALVCVGLLSLFVAFVSLTKSTKLSVDALTENYSHGQFVITSASGEKMDTSSLFITTPIQIENVPKHVQNSFIAIEDKRFFSHHGIDFKRMASATIKNLKNRKFSEGASTISQQLIKNTHLSREKTLERKAKEIKLSLQLEKKFSKNEILEMYLNNIYFGNGCYGIEKAARFYFSKDVENLTLNEGALLAGIINAPSYYDPITHEDRALNRRNVVLSCMAKNGFISSEDYQKNAKLPLNIVKNSSKSLNDGIKSILSEAAKVLNVNENQLKNMKVNIKTTLDERLENEVMNAVSGDLVPTLSGGGKPAVGVIIVDNKSKSIVAMAGNTRYNLLSLKRQPGSTIKPIIAYSPALERGLIYPDSIIVDEEIYIDGYSPSNYNDKYLGNVSAREALAKSLNIPAVKLLSKVGVTQGKEFAKKLGISFNEKDQNLALALGGMTDGVTIQEIADAYSTFASEGTFARSKLIESITSEDNTILYSRTNNPSKVIREDTAYLITNMLCDTVKNGTARRLSSLNIPVAAKTGTVGAGESGLNSDAYSVCYTTDYTIVSWIGAVDRNKLDKGINGASYPTLINKQLLGNIYSSSSPADFQMPESVELRAIDTRKLAKNKIELASPNTPIEFKRPSLFSTYHLPKVSEDVAEPVKLEVFMEEGQKPTLSFETLRGPQYLVYRGELGTNKFELINQFVGDEQVVFTDSNAESQKMYEYYVLTKVGPHQEKSNSIKLKVS